MAAKPDGRPANQRVTFTKAAADRIASVVREVESGKRDGAPIRFTPSNAGRQKAVFRVCTFTGSWSVGSLKTVTFRNVSTTPNTVSATNLFANITMQSSSSSIPKSCAVARDGTAWYLIAAEC